MTSGKPKFLLLVAAISFPAVIGVVWMLTNNQKAAVDSFKPGTPLHTVKFNDGSQVEIYGLGIGEWTDGTVTPPASGAFSAFTTGSSTYYYGDEKNYLQTDTHTVNKKVTGLRLYVRDKDLLLSVRFMAPSSRSVMPDEMTDIKLKVELSDNHGAWLKGYGPHGSPDDPHNRGVIGFEGWPRTGSDLTFRATLDEGKPIEFKLPNPNHGHTPEPWKPVRLPHTIHTSDWEITLKEVFEMEVPGRGPAIVPEHTFTDKVSEESQELAYIDLNTENVLGSNGTESGLTSTRDASRGLRLAHFMPKDENLFKFRYTIRRREHYPYPPKDFVVVANAKVSSDGKQIRLLNTRPDIGITSVDFGPVTTPKPRFHSGRLGFDFQIKLEYKNAKEKQKIDSMFGDWLDVRTAVFTPSDSHSLGVLARNSSGKSTNFGGSGDYEWQGTWYGDLKPSQELSIGIAKGIPDETCEIVVSRKALKALPED